MARSNPTRTPSGILTFFTGLVVLVILSSLVRSLLYVSAPNEALIFSGRVRRVGQREIGYRVARGGRSRERNELEVKPPQE